MYSLDNRHALAIPYWMRPQLRFAVDGGKGGATKTKAKADEDEDEDLDEDEEFDDPDPYAEMDEDELREAIRERDAKLASTSARAKKGSGATRQLRGELNRLKIELAKTPKKAAAKGADDDEDKISQADIDAARAAAKLEGQTETEKKAIRASIRAQLRGMGVSKEDLADAVRLVDADDLDLDDDGEVDGLDDAIDDLRTRRPEFFKGTRRAPTRKIAGDAENRGSSRKTAADDRTVSQMQADKLLGR